MSIKKCINEIQRAAKSSGVELLEDEILDILDILERRVKRRKAAGTNKSESDIVVEALAWADVDGQPGAELMVTDWTRTSGNRIWLRERSE